MKNISKEAWQEDLRKFGDKYHIYTTWLAIVFNPIFGITDFFNIQHAWKQLLVFRLSITVVCLIALGIRQYYRYSSKVLVFIPFLLISIQNAYTYSLIEVSDFTGHTLNYIALFIGAGMFIMWNWYYSALIILISAIANSIFFNMNHRLDLEHALVNGGLLLIVVSLFMFLLIETRRRLTIVMIKSKRALLEANLALEEQRQIVEEKNKHITDSINYAKRIQTAILPLEEKLRKALPEHFILFKPKDIVSGDFYWFAEKEGKHIMAAVDCTGHGVPGAFMSMIADSILNHIVHDREIHQADLILNEMHLGIRQALQQATNQNKDGMDLSLVVIDYQHHCLKYAGAKNPIIYIQHGELMEIKGDKMPIGGEQREERRVFKQHLIPLIDEDKQPLKTTFYIFSDGFQDQFGGKQKQKFSIGRMRKKLLEIHQLDMLTQSEILETTLEDWKQTGKEKQIDDVLIFGVRV
jgi:serine phosphatase RsbU (regulator of sigma subunit)